MSELTSKRIVFGVTGGIAAYKAAELTRLLVKAGATVDVVMTEAATHFVGAATFQALSGRPVWTDLWLNDSRMTHIDLTRGAAAVLVAPATADFLARLAHGMADDLLTALCLARPCDCPLLVAPAMNCQMWEQPVTQRNVAQLVADGVAVLGPAIGEQACGETGAGRMLEAQELFDELFACLQPKRLSGKKVLLTVGPTFEALDPVRGLTNRSSGKMGLALAHACVEAGAEVTLVAGPLGEKKISLHGARRIDVESALEMRAAVFAALSTGQDIFIAVAAVADYRPVQISEHKIKKEGAQKLTLELVANPDILAEVAAHPDAPFCVGFAAESRNLAEHAESKRKAKKLPLVVGNLAQEAIGSDTNQVTLFDAAGAHPLPAGSKLAAARGIVAHIARLMKCP